MLGNTFPVLHMCTEQRQHCHLNTRFQLYTPLAERRLQHMLMLKDTGLQRSRPSLPGTRSLHSQYTAREQRTQTCTTCLGDKSSPKRCLRHRTIR